jgi:hypothetical protein
MDQPDQAAMLTAVAAILAGSQRPASGASGRDRIVGVMSASGSQDSLPPNCGRGATMGPPACGGQSSPVVRGRRCHGLQGLFASWDDWRGQEVFLIVSTALLAFRAEFSVRRAQRGGQLWLPQRRRLAQPRTSLAHVLCPCRRSCPSGRSLFLRTTATDITRHSLITVAKAWRNPAASTTSTPGITLDDAGSFNHKTMPNGHRERGAIAPRKSLAVLFVDQ